MKTRFFLTLGCLLCCAVLRLAANPIDGLLNRIDKGAASKFKIELVKSDKDFFELSQAGPRVVVRGNSYVNIASGINWYLKYYAGIQLSWNGMHAQLPARLPAVEKPIRKETELTKRYYLNYCTFSYSMAFWDWKRWEEEIDWMALHGINLPLAAVGEECVWFNMLKKLGYSKQEINDFIAGPAFLAWWAMNNLEGWGGPNPDNWYKQQAELQKRIVRRMKEYGMEPVFPGYSGMLPHNAKEKLGLDLASPEPWNGFTRPAFLLPTDKRFDEIASLYYKEQMALFGRANYYSMDPFHESKNAENVDFAKAGRAIFDAMRKVNKDAVWVIQGWTENPREEMIRHFNTGDLLILDLFSECRPMWGIPSLWQRKEGYRQHNWAFCMLENFGANVGLHGRMDQLLENFYATKNNPLAKHLSGIGLTMEGIENNPVMFELMTELPWRNEAFKKEQWMDGYLKARYGKADEDVSAAWDVLIHSIYNCPRGNNQQGPHESIFCGRPSMNNFQVSSWSKMKNYYDPTATRRAAERMLAAAERFRGNNNFEYDLVDIVRQSLADEGRIVYNRMIADFKSFDRQSFEKDANRFLQLILFQDRLLGTRREFRLGHWTEQARALGKTDDERRLYEWNARTQITTWGNRYSANEGGLRDYAHKEWNGLLKDLYYNRWAAFINDLRAQFDGKEPTDIDYYQMEEEWTKRQNTYSSSPVGNAIDVAKEVMQAAF